MSKLKKIIDGKVHGSKTAEFVAQSNTLVLLKEHTINIHNMQLKLKGTSGYHVLPDALTYRNTQYQEVEVVKGLTYQIEVIVAPHKFNGEDIKYGEAVISICFKEQHGEA